MRNRRRMVVVATTVFFGVVTIAAAAAVFREAKPFVFDPGNTRLVQSGWLAGIGCPTDAHIYDGTSNVPYEDPACPTGDRRDRANEGLLLAKTGPTENVASAGVVLREVRGITVTELGYDIRKPGVSADPRGSHCGAGAPRFNITTEGGHTFFLGCNSPPAPVQQPGNGWLRLRWGGTVPVEAYNAQTGALTDISRLEVRRISIVFDEGQDTGPDNFGLAVLDNIDVNGQLVGQGEPPQAGGHDEGDDHNGNDEDHHDD